MYPLRTLALIGSLTALAGAIGSTLVDFAASARNQRLTVDTLESLQGLRPLLPGLLTQDTDGKLSLDVSTLSLKDAWGNPVEFCVNTRSTGITEFTGVSRGPDGKASRACALYPLNPESDLDSSQGDTGDDVFWVLPVDQVIQGLGGNPLWQSDLVKPASTGSVPNPYLADSRLSAGVPGAVRIGAMRRRASGLSTDAYAEYVDDQGVTRAFGVAARGSATSPYSCASAGMTAAIPAMTLPSGYRQEARCVTNYLQNDTTPSVGTSSAIVLMDWQSAQRVCASKGLRLITDAEYTAMAHHLAAQSSNWVPVAGDSTRVQLVRGYYTTAAAGTSYSQRFLGVGTTNEENRRLMYTGYSHMLWDAAGIPSWTFDQFPISLLTESTSSTGIVVKAPQRGATNVPQGLSVDDAPQVAFGAQWNSTDVAGQVVVSKGIYACSNRTPDYCATPSAPVKALVGIRGVNFNNAGVREPSAALAGGLFSKAVFQAPSNTAALAAARCTSPVVQLVSE